MRKNLKTIVIVILALVIVFESVALVLTKKDSGNESDVITVPVQGTVAEQPEQPQAATPLEITGGLLSGLLGDGNVGDMLRNMIYSNSIVSALMSAVYPMLYNELNNGGMLDFGPSIHLYATGKLLADQLGNVPYTAVDRDGMRKPLTEILRTVDTNWQYMDSVVKYTDSNDVEQKTTIWNSIDWKVSDQDSFYSAMNNMTLGFRGLLETCMQNKEGVVTINLLEFALDIDKIPVNLDAAVITNTSEKSGYEMCLIYLFNVLGLVDGEYPTSEEFCAYETMGEVWKAIIESVIKAVEKIMTDPANKLASVLINLVNAIDSGRLVSGFRAMHMYGTYHALAKMAMGLEDGEVFNLGNTLIGIIEDMGITITGKFQDTLKGVVAMVAKKDVAIPVFDVAGFVACGTPTTLPNGNTIYTANADSVYGYFVDYLMQGDLLKLILGMTGMFDEADANEIIAAFNAADDGISNLIKVVLKVVLGNLVETNAA